MVRPEILIIAAVLLSGCQGGADDPAGKSIADTTAESIEPWFDEAASQLGVDFHHFNGMSGDLHMAEITGSGGAVFDYDRDGDLDLYLVQGTMLHPDKPTSDAAEPPRHAVPLTDRLYRNELRPGDADSLRFVDVTTAAGDLGVGYGMGVTVGDYDRDGWPDLYVTNHGSNQLLRNQGDGTFRDLTAAAGASDDSWSVAATFVDVDRDGWLDLFVGNYLDLPREARESCNNLLGAPDYCGPENFNPVADRLLHNNGDGTFDDIGREAGLSTGFGPALGVTTADFNRDGWIDLYVTNDARPNNYWVNRGNGLFEDQALLAGNAVNSEGRAEASMGVGTADYDGDGDLDLFVTHLISETNTLYANDGQGFFDDLTTASGLGSPSRLHTAFGTGWLDMDGDSRLDLVVVNGAVKRIEALVDAGDPFPLHEQNQLFLNLGGGRFEEATDRGGPALELSEVSRGLVLGDLDNDGDTDLVISNNNGPARVLVRRGHPRRWLGLRLIDDGADAVGADLELSSDSTILHRRVHVDGSYASASDPRVLVVPLTTDSPTISVRWTDGRTETWSNIQLDRYTTLVKGEGERR